MTVEKKIRRARFVIYGSPIGFKTTTKRGKWSDNYKRYVVYKELVQREATAAGIKLPLQATKDRPLMIRTVAYFKNGKHPDPGNVQKGVCDALFYDQKKAAMAKLKGRKSTGKGDDKYTGGSFPPPRYDKLNPRVIVIIEDYAPKVNGKGVAQERSEIKKKKVRDKAPKKNPRKAR